MSKLIDITGKKYNHLLVVGRAENAPGGVARWKCLCDCGCYTIVRGANLKNGAVKSCGCLKKTPPSTKHNMSHTPIFDTWCNMRRRCKNPKHKSYKDYGGRGIMVCDEWDKSFEAFYAWATKSGYKEGLTIERIDVDGNYCPENCTWIRKDEQAANRRMNLKITYKGKTQNLKQWCDELELDYKFIHNRIRKSGLTFEQAVVLPFHWDRQ